MNEFETRDAFPLVEMLADAGGDRWKVMEALRALGPAALPAVREGLGHGNWQVRRCCAIWFAHNGSAESLPLLIPLLRDRWTLDTETDRKLHKWAGIGLFLSRAKGQEAERGQGEGEER